MFKFLKDWLLPQHPTQPTFRGQTFILEPILTPSGIIDIDDDSPFDLLDSLPDNIDNPDLPDISTDDLNIDSPDSDEFQEIDFLPASAPEIETHLDTYTSGTEGVTRKWKVRLCLGYRSLRGGKKLSRWA